MTTRRDMPVQLRAAPDEGEGVFIGMVTVYDVEYRVGPGLKESISRGAFDASIARRGNTIPLFYEHKWSDGPIGVGNLTSTADGVQVRAQLFMDDARARSIWQAGAGGVAWEWSVGFLATDVRFDSGAGGNIERVDEGELLESSVVVMGANPEAKNALVRGAVVTEPDPEPKVETRAFELDPDIAERVLTHPALRKLYSEIDLSQYSVTVNPTKEQG